MKPLRWQFIFATTLLLAGLFSVRAYAHDALQSSTNIWLRPDQMEVELVLSRVPSRSLVDNPPPVPVTEDNFESTYHALFQKSAPALLEITLDGKKIEPSSITVGLFEETDLRIDYLFPRPPNGKLRFTASFVQRMDEGYVNTLGVNEDRNVLGYGDQSADQLTWEMNLGTDKGIPAPSSARPLPPLPAGLTATPPMNSSSPEKIVVADQAKGTVADKNFFFYSVVFWVIVSLLLLGAFIWLRKKNRSTPSG